MASLSGSCIRQSLERIHRRSCRLLHHTCLHFDKDWDRKDDISRSCIRQSQEDIRSCNHLRPLPPDKYRRSDRELADKVLQSRISPRQSQSDMHKRSHYPRTRRTLHFDKDSVHTASLSGSCIHQSLEGIHRRSCRLLHHTFLRFDKDSVDMEGLSRNSIRQSQEDIRNCNRRRPLPPDKYRHSDRDLARKLVQSRMSPRQSQSDKYKKSYYPRSRKSLRFDKDSVRKAKWLVR